jgi:hypothetical protein
MTRNVTEAAAVLGTAYSEADLPGFKRCTSKREATGRRGR